MYTRKRVEDGLRVNKTGLIFYFHQSTAKMLNRSWVVSKEIILYPKGWQKIISSLAEIQSFSFIGKLESRTLTLLGKDKRVTISQISPLCILSIFHYINMGHFCIRLKILSKFAFLMPWKCDISINKMLPNRTSHIFIGLKYFKDIFVSDFV